MNYTATDGSLWRIYRDTHYNTFDAWHEDYDGAEGAHDQRRFFDNSIEGVTARIEEYVARAALASPTRTEAPGMREALEDAEDALEFYADAHVYHPTPLGGENPDGVSPGSPPDGYDEPEIFQDDCGGRARRALAAVQKALGARAALSAPAAAECRNVTENAEGDLVCACFICPQCGLGVASDEDGCCASCGATLCTPEVLRAIRGAPPAARQDDVGALREALQDAIETVESYGEAKACGFSMLYTPQVNKRQVERWRAALVPFAARGREEGADNG